MAMKKRISYDSFCNELDTTYKDFKFSVRMDTFGDVILIASDGEKVFAQEIYGPFTDLDTAIQHYKITLDKIKNLIDDYVAEREAYDLSGTLTATDLGVHDFKISDSITPFRHTEEKEKSVEKVVETEDEEVNTYKPTFDSLSNWFDEVDLNRYIK